MHSTYRRIYRWQSDDSELFFLFYKHYHNTLKTYIGVASDTQCNNEVLARLPGYVYLASYFAGKIESLIQRQIISVTNATTVTISSPWITSETNAIVSVVQCNSERLEQADRLSYQSGKPVQLEIATKRYAECIVWCIMDSYHLYKNMLNIWLRAAIKKTRLVEAEQVYCKHSITYFKKKKRISFF